ncbi:hypothetical protein [Streptomyces lunalinharesii]|uniref:Uncharacterized protein n=1 Tax=Streptomyces lunalinharesii TaxID=333384 RepID=A0ABN3RIU1_9ACTN
MREWGDGPARPPDIDRRPAGRADVVKQRGNVLRRRRPGHRPDGGALASGAGRATSSDDTGAKQCHH